MADDIPFDRDPSVESGSCVRVSPLVRRLVAANPGPFTFTGTCGYIVGHGEVAVIDPGPDLPGQVEALLAALQGETVTQIVVTHTHRDHSPAARPLQEATGAPIIGCGVHRRARAPVAGESSALEASGDVDHNPDRELRDGDVVRGPGWDLEAVATPGHAANHLAFALRQENALFSGDHVMAWSTTVVAPPGGAMGDYMASLEKLRGRPETIYWPGHGGPVREPQRFLRALIHHRRQREASILARLAAGDRTIAAMVPALYQGLAPGLLRAAGLSVFAHLEDLVARGLVASDGPPRLEASYRLA